MENRFLIAIILITGFIMAVSAASMYVQFHITEGTMCGCPFPIELLIPLLSSAGLLIGCLVYYFMSSYLKPRKQDLLPVLSVLDYDQRAVIEQLVKSGGSAPQSKLVSATGMNKVKVSRVVSTLESKGVLHKTTSGVTNLVELDEKLKRVFI